MADYNVNDLVLSKDGNTYRYSPPVMNGATSSSGGAQGLVPAPTSGSTNQFLKSDGTWSNLPNYSIILELSATVTELPMTITDSSITSDMVVVDSKLETPTAQATTWVVDTSNGSLTISGTLYEDASTGILLRLAKPQI